jgi:hypothetical protein
MTETATAPDPRVTMLRQALRPGDSFCDVGGVEKNEMVTEAAKLGAVSLSMLDARPADDPLWEVCWEKWRAAGLTVEPLSWPIEEFRINYQWDVVHCGSVLHHVYDVETALAGLRRITRHQCVLTVVVCEYGEGSAEPLKALVGPNAPGFTVPSTGAIEDWRSLYDEPHMAGMVRAAGFEILDSSRHWHGHLLTMRLR